MSGARFKLYVKAGSDGQCLGDCPFSQRVTMIAWIKLKSSDVEVLPVNTIEKPEDFLKINPEGKVPVLVDCGNNNKIIADSTEIMKYINVLFPLPDLKQTYDGPALAASSGIFSKLAAYLKNKDESKENDLKAELNKELKKLNDCLESQKDRYLVCGELCELDCQILPKLRHVQIAGGHYKGFEIPEEFAALRQYIKCGESNPVFIATCPPDEQFVWGWSKFF